ncbi:MAG: sigE [Myxococcales bacterium]|nr:sigE [Myxococcales bacterium]
MIADHLSRHEELALCKRYRRGHDRRIEERLVRSQMGLVHRLARTHGGDNVDHDDLVQEGLVGLLKGIRRFDSAIGARLSTYVVWWIRAYQYSYIIKNHRLVRLGTTQTQRRLFFGLRGLRARFLACGLEPTDERMAAHLGANTDEVRQMAERLDSRELSLDVPAHDDSPESFGAGIRASSPLPEQLAMAHESERIVGQECDRFRATLTGRKRELFDARWRHDEPPTLQALGDRFGVSRERIRQIERSMLNELRRRLEPRLALAV